MWILNRFSYYPIRGGVQWRGAGVLGLLIVVVIILFLTLTFLGPDEANKVNMATTQMDRSRDAVCDLNINTMQSYLTQIQLANAGTNVTLKILEKKNMLYKCSGGGEYVLKNGKIYCTKHSPPPEESPTPGASPTPADVVPVAVSVTPAAP